jgi:transcriptional regulator with XRE-family HTH domain
MEGIGQRIYEERKKKGMSQGELGEKLDLSAKAVSKWETGETQPTLDNVARLAEIFGVSTDYLLKGNDTNPNASAAHLHYLEPQKEARHRLRVAGWIVGGIGVAVFVAGLATFLTNFVGIDRMASSSGINMGSGITGMVLFGVGGLLIIAGVVLLYFGYFGAVSRYAASEVAPVAKDTANYMLDGTRDEFGKTIKTVVPAAAQTDKGPLCPKCGTQNEKGALYCDNCGAPLTKKCPACGEVNDADAKHCRKCGKPLL